MEENNDAARQVRKIKINLVVMVDTCRRMIIVKNM